MQIKIPIYTYKSHMSLKKVVFQGIIDVHKVGAAIPTRDLQRKAQ